MFERFTDRARRVVVLAQEDAKVLGHLHIGTEHLLLGLLHEGDGVAAKTLASLGISLEAARNQATDIIGGGTSPLSHLPFSPRAKKVLELSLREALQLGHNYISTEHILLALIREGQGVGTQIIVRLGGNLGVVREEIMKAIIAAGQIKVANPTVTPITDSTVDLRDAALRVCEHYRLVGCGDTDGGRLLSNLERTIERSTKAMES